MLFGAAYYPEHRDPSMWDYDLDMMASAGVNAVRIGEFAWKRLEPSPNIFDFSWVDSFVAKAGARGIGTLLCPPLRTAPSWLVSMDPSMLIVTGSGVRLEFGSRYTFCLNNALLRERGLALATTMARHYAGSTQVVGWHLDNEYGDDPDCHCPLCRQKFQQWLAAEYGTIQNLNFTWGTVFWGLEVDTFDQIPTPRLTKASLHPAHVQAWRRYQSALTVEIVRLHGEAVRAQASPTQWVTTNNQALWNARTDYYDMARHLDICGTNYYPPYGERCRDAAFALATSRSFKQKNFQVHELRSGPHTIPGKGDNGAAPGEIARESWHVVANGADAIFYFRWRTCPFGPEQNHGAIMSPDGSPTRIYDEVKQVGLAFRNVAPVLDGTSVQSDVAILYDFPTRWMTETGAEWEGPRDLYVSQCVKIYRAIRGFGVNCDAVGRGGEFGRYRVLVIPMLAAFDDTLAGKLLEFIEDGGTLVWHPLCGQRTSDACIYPQRLHPAIKDILGVKNIEITTERSGAGVPFQWNKKTFTGELYFELISTDSARVASKYQGAWFAGYPALLDRKLGQGRILYVTCFAGQAFYDSFLPWVLKSKGISPILPCELPPEIEVAERSAPDGRRVVFLMNSSGSETSIKPGVAATDLVTGEKIGQRLTLGPNGVRVLLLSETEEESGHERRCR